MHQQHYLGRGEIYYNSEVDINNDILEVLSKQKHTGS
jgi:hypothetical protein